MAFADTQKLVVELDLKGNFKTALRGVRDEFRNFDKATSRTQKSLGKFGSNITKGIAIGAGAIAASGLLVIHAASDYESAFAGVRKTVTATEPQLQELSDQFRNLSKTIPISAAELARLGEVGGALGIPIDQMEEFVRVTALLGETTDLTADDAANSLGILGNVLHLTGEDYSKFASSLVALGNAGASTESQIIAIAERAGAAGELVGLTTEEVLGLSSAVASLGIEPEAGGTALQKFFIDTTKFVAQSDDELKILAKTAGLSGKAFKKAFKDDAGKALQAFLAGLGKLPQAAQLKVLEDLGFNDARITRTLLGLANNTAFAENTALTKEADQRNKTFASQMQITKNVLTDVAITIGSKLLPKLTPLLQKLNAFVAGHQGDIERFGTDLAAGFERFADAVGKTDWTPFIDGLKLSASLAKGAFDAFNALPDDFKKLILVGAGVNKITGGLITSLGKDIIGSLGGQFLGRGSSPANPLWVQSVGGVGGGVGGVAGGGLKGKLGGAVGLLGKVFIVGVAAEAAQEIHDALGTNLQERTDAGQLLPTDQLQWPFGPKNTPKLNLGPLQGLLGGDSALRAVDKLNSTFQATSATAAQRQNVANERLEAIRGAVDIGAQRHVAATDRAEQQTVANLAALKAANVAAIGAAAARASGDSHAEQSRIASAAAANVAATAKAAAASHAAGQAAAAAIRDKKMSFTTNVSVRTSVSIREQIKQLNTYKSTHRTAS